MKFEIYPCGDPYNKYGWNVREVTDKGCFYRGDISPMQGKNNTIRYLRRNYPKCKISCTK